MSGSIPPALRRLILAVDLVGYSTLDHLRQLAVQQRLVEVMERACAGADVDRAACTRQPQGDGEVLLLPPALDEGRVVPRLVQQLALSLRQMNRDLALDSRLRLRAAMHQGIVQEAANGFVSRAGVRTCRMLDSSAPRTVMETLPACELALVVSESLFEDVLEHGYQGLDPDLFVRYRTDLPAKKFATEVWMYLAFTPELLPPPSTAPTASPAPSPPPSPGPAPGRFPVPPPVPTPEQVAPALYQPEIFRRFGPL
ncbi:hypothetical protein AB0D49_14160 [Streptomyces sp. NPDC048290]|uniref:hypothetical protein n=1 Tax=Streptomyces sp. NPDC048290 TaxID=3155811 RepID=UPI003424FB73